MYSSFDFLYRNIPFPKFWILIVISPFVYRLFDIYEPGVCHFIDCEASLGNLSPLLDPSHPACEIIREDTQWLRSNFL